MRAKIFIHKTGKQPLPYDYQYYLAGMLLTKLRTADVEFANELHASTDFKYYTFSYIKYTNSMKQTSHSKGLHFDEGHFFLSSPDKKFIRSFCEGLLESPEFHLNGIDMRVERIEILPHMKFNGKKTTFKMISPLFLKTRVEENGELVEKDLYPTDGKFYENFHSTLARKYQTFYGQAPDDNHFYLTTLGRFKPKRHRIGDGRRRASLLTFQLDAPQELVSFGYEAGFGEKTAMGFGCAEVVGDDGRGRNQREVIS